MYLKLIKSLFFILISVCTFGQSSLKLFFEVSPNYGYRSFKINKDNNEKVKLIPAESIYNILVDFSDSLESAKSGVSIVLGVSYKKSKRINLKTGIGYKNIGEKISYKEIIGRYEAGNMIIPIYGDNLVSENKTYHYITLPLNVQFDLLNKERWSWGIEAGLNFDIFLKQKKTNYEVMFKSDYYRKYIEAPSLAAVINFGFFINYKLNERINLYLTPSFGKNITPNLKYDIHIEGKSYLKYSQYQYYGEVKVGLNYKI